MALFVFAHSRHTARKLHHGRTSYASLSFLLLLCGVLLSTYSMSASAVENPQDGSVGLSGAVRGPAPTQPAVIQNPLNGFRLTSSPTTVSGSCQVGTFVSLYRNGVFSGMVPCNDDGTFSMLSDLFAGQNILYTRVSDALDQFGPDSARVTVFYAPTSIDNTQNILPSPFFLASSVGVIGVSPGQSVERTITIYGGFSPYAINWDFGDGTNTSVPQSAAGDASISHTYSRPGTYSVIVRVTDSSGNTSIIQLVTVVNGPVSGISSTTRGKTDIGGLALGAWPLYLLAVLMVLVFWLGERREVWLLRSQNKLAAGV